MEVKSPNNDIAVKKISTIGWPADLKMGMLCSVISPHINVVISVHYSHTPRVKVMLTASGAVAQIMKVLPGHIFQPSVP
jgi:hypothetical protein